MNNLQKIVMLIDADNTQLNKLEGVIREVSTRGRIVVKRAYGNWKKEVLKNWEDEIKRLAINPIQQFDYVSGKNATDMALVIDAINLLNRDIYDGFVIVASDSDYTPLAINLHESGVYIIGAGEKKTPEAFINSCDDFIYLENIEIGGSDNNPEHQVNKSNVKKDAVNNKNDIEKVHKLLKLAYEKYQDDDGFVNVSSAGTFIKRIKPDFDAITYGYLKLPKLIEAFPDKYEMKRYSGKGTVTIIAYKCKE